MGNRSAPGRPVRLALDPSWISTVAAERRASSGEISQQGVVAREFSERSGPTEKHRRNLRCFSVEQLIW
jgi:hypothetical protein